MISASHVVHTQAFWGKVWFLHRLVSKFHNALQALSQPFVISLSSIPPELNFFSFLYNILNLPSMNYSKSYSTESENSVFDLYAVFVKPPLLVSYQALLPSLSPSLLKEIVSVLNHNSLFCIDPYTLIVERVVKCRLTSSASDFSFDFQL